MKAIISLCFVFACVLSVSSVLGQEANSKNEQIEIKTSAQCDQCKQRIEKVLVYEKGIRSADLDVETRVVTVKYNPKKTTPDKIRLAISKTGYDADDVMADEVSYEKLPACCKKDGIHAD